MVGALNHLLVVFNNHNAVAALNQCVKGHQQAVDVVEVEAGGGFVENEERGCARSRLR